MKERTVTSDQLECKEEGGEDVHYHEGTLFTGRVEDFDENGQKLHACNFNEGLLDGLWTWWHTNGNKMGEANWKEGNLGLVTSWYKNGKKERVGNWKDGKVISFEVWRQNGETCPVTNVKDGNGVLAWYDFELWPEGGRLTYKDGKLVGD